MTKYHLYYHDDLDGVASGAILYDFFGDFLSCTPMEYSAHLQENYQPPFVLVDFQYHPAANWWIDHHASAFKNPEHKAAYRDNAQHCYDPSAPSACGLVARFLHDQHDYALPEAAKKLVEVVDIDDSAGFATLADALELESPSKKIQLLLGDSEAKKNREQYLAFREFLIKNLITQGMEAIAGMPEYQERIAHLRAMRLAADETLKREATLDGRVVVVTKTDATSHASRWAAYAAYPEAPYSVQVHDKGGEYKVGIGSNKWSKEKPTADLGALARTYGGGGHAGVGAISVKTREEAEKIAQEIIKILNG